MLGWRAVQSFRVAKDDPLASASKRGPLAAGEGHGPGAPTAAHSTRAPLVTSPFTLQGMLTSTLSPIAVAVLQLPVPALAVLVSPEAAAAALPLLGLPEESTTTPDSAASIDGDST